MIFDSRINEKLKAGESQVTDLSVADALSQLNMMQQKNTPNINSEDALPQNDRLENTNSLQSLVTADIQDMVLGILKLEEQDFSPTTPLMDYGLDSIASTEIGNLFTSKFNIVIPPTVFFEFQDLKSFVQYLTDNHLAELQKLYGKSTVVGKQPNIKTNIQETQANPPIQVPNTVQNDISEPPVIQSSATSNSVSVSPYMSNSSIQQNNISTTPVIEDPINSSVSTSTVIKEDYENNLNNNETKKLDDQNLLNLNRHSNLDLPGETISSINLVDIESLWQESDLLLQPTLSYPKVDEVKQPSREFLESMKKHTEAANIHLVNRLGKRPLEYASYGEGPPLLMLGGLLMHYSVMWLTNIEALAAKHELIMYHMPGCGELPLQENMSLHSLAEDIAAVLDAHGVQEPLAVFGCSFGGVMAQAFALAFPERVSALAIAVSTPLAEGATNFQALMKELQVSSNFMELNRGWPMASLPTYEKVIDGFDFRQALKTLDMPSLVVSGGQDNYTTSAHGKMIADSLVNSQFVEFPDAGHLLTFSHHAEFNSLLLEFMSSNTKSDIKTYSNMNMGNGLASASQQAYFNISKSTPIKRKTLEYAAEYVNSGQQGHCIMLSDHSAQAAKVLRDLTVKNKPASADYRSYFVTSREEALDAAIRIARHQARNRDPKSSGRVLIIEQGIQWQNYFNPLYQGEQEALVPSIIFTNNLEAAITEYSLDQFVAVVVVANQQTTIQELQTISSKLMSLPAMSVLIDSEFTNSLIGEKRWLSIEMQTVFDLIVHGEEISGYQAPVACVMIEKSLSNPWLMTPNEGYVRQPMASLGLPLHLTYQHCREQFYEELSPRVWAQIDSLKGDQAQTYLAHCNYGNIGYAKVANIHGFDQRFEQGFGLHTQIIESDPDTGTETRRNLIDCLSNVGAAPRGQNPQDLVSDVFAKHNSELDYWAELEQKLTAITGFQTCIPASSQNSAIERAITLGMLANSHRKKLLCFSGGAGFSMLSANTANDPIFDLFRKPFQPLYPHIIFIDPHDSNAEIDLAKHLMSGDIAFVWLETIQVEGNAVNTLPENLIRLVNQHKPAGGYLIGVDETQTNVGTGKFLHSENLVNQADIIAISTSLTDCVLPCGAVLSTKKVYQRALDKNPNHVGYMKQTQANPLAGHLALHSLQKITQQNLLSHAHDMGVYLKTGLQNLANQYPLLKQVRGEGLVLAIEFDLKDYSAFIQQSFGYFLWGAMMRDPIQGVLMVVCPVHNHSLRVMPPLTINVEEADQIIANIKRRLDEGVERILLGCADYARKHGDVRTAKFLETSLGSVVKADSPGQSE